ncbi:uroporphyrinogen-III synthase [Planctomonas sp. JC2975]|uniref:uroporphyrinogen-III synthase n=1 Tax=Planctomonas sp. JC2975 TaxID=2729626 RepID=UPI001472A590|nr:uroporphyrinogen-III synthase [Planctomonas sp. JC2975]NNC10965.1 uroporphyrinogen-III synthase [Planctomonas sp. JC2975]
MTEDGVETTETIPGFRPDQLQGFRIGVTSDRRSGDLIDAFERRGAQVIHAPTIRMVNADADDPVIADTRAMIAARPDILLATTAYGIRRWFEVSDAAGLGEDLVAALSRAEILVRGPKARGGIRAAGLDDAGMSDEETTASLVDRVLASYPPGRTVAVQVHGRIDEPQLERLRAAGHRVLTVAPYSWRTTDDSDLRVQRLIEAACSDQLDCITFTSAPAVEALFDAADALGRRDDLLDAMTERVVPAVVGPVTAAPLLAAGLSPLQPDRFRMGALIRLVCEHLERTASDGLRTPHGRVQLRGTVVRIGDRRVPLTPAQVAVFGPIFRARGAVVSRDQLSRILVGTVDDHVLDMALSRLRTALGAPGLITTVVKRGYRIDVLEA